MSCINKIRTIGLLLVILTGFVSCSSNKEEEKTSLKTIKVGVLPDESRNILLSRYNQFREYLSRETGLQVQLLIPKNYKELLDFFHNEKIDLAV